MQIVYLIRVWYPEYIKNSHNSAPKDKIEKLAIDLNRYFSKEDIQMTNKHIKRCSAPQSLLLLLLLLLLLSHFSRVQLCATHRRQPTRLRRPWDSPGKNTGVGRHFLLQCMKGKRESEVAQSCLTLCDPMDCSPPGSSIHGIFQARVLEWGSITFSGILCYFLVLS